MVIREMNSRFLAVLKCIELLDWKGLFEIIQDIFAWAKGGHQIGPFATIDLG